jgi:hypothetical protein
MSKFGLSIVIIFSPFFTHAQLGIINTVAGNGTIGYSGDGGPATSGQIGGNSGIGFDKQNNYYFVEANHTIRKVSSVGILSTIAGNGSPGFGGDGGAATSAILHRPLFVAIGKHDDLFFTDAQNNRVRKIDAATGVITTIAGNGIGGYAGDGLPATNAELNSPSGICIDTFGNLYISDQSNYRIRKVDISGYITTICGTGVWGIGTDGGLADTTQIGLVNGICSDNYNNIFITDGDRIRKIDAITGVISTYAGNGVSGNAGDEGPALAAQLMDPYAITFDRVQRLYIACMYGSVVRVVDSSGVIHRVAGNGTAGFSGDGGVDTAARVNLPEGIAADACGNIYFCDLGNNRIRKVTYPPILTTPTISLSSASSYPAGSTVTVTATVGSAGSSYIIHWLNHGIEFTTTTVPSVTYTKPPGTDTITARIVPTGWGCWDSTISSQHIVSTDVTGVSSISEPWCIVYPNPAHTTLTAATPWNEGTLAIYNTIGQTVLAKQFYKRGIPVNIGNLPAGIYVLKITGAENETVITKFIKQ